MCVCVYVPQLAVVNASTAKSVLQAAAGVAHNMLAGAHNHRHHRHQMSTHTYTQTLSLAETHIHLHTHTRMCAYTFGYPYLKLSGSAAARAWRIIALSCSLALDIYLFLSLFPSPALRSCRIELQRQVRCPSLPSVPAVLRSKSGAEAGAATEK